MKTIIYILFISIMFMSCGNKSEENVTESNSLEHVVKLNDEQIKNAGIVIGKLESRTISSVLKVNGKIDVPPQNMVSISIPLGGFLKSTELLPGMHIKKGQVIAVMEDQQYIQLQQDYLTSRSKLSYLENEYNRQKELNQSKASSDKAYQLAEAEYKAEKVNERSLQEKLKLIHLDPDKLNENNISRSISITAPIDGYVSQVNVNVGKYVNPTDVLFELVNPNDIHLNLTVFEKDINKLYVGQKLLAYTNNEPEKKYECEVLLIGQNLTNERNIEVHCHFESYNRVLIPGMYMNAEIQVKTQNALSVNDDAIVSHEGKSYLFFKKDANTFEMIQVETGISENGFTEVITKLAGENNQVVTKGAYSLLMSLMNKTEE